MTVVVLPRWLSIFLSELDDVAAGRQPIDAAWRSERSRATKNDVARSGEPPLASRAAFSDFYERTHRSVFRYVMAMTGDQGESEEITADAYFRAWRRRETFSGDDDAAMGWIITIARRQAIDRLRSVQRHPQAELDDGLPSADIDIDDLVVADEQVGLVWQALRDLPWQQREVLVLRYMFGWRVQAIAAHLELSENAVSVRIRRALQKMKVAITALGVDSHG